MNVDSKDTATFIFASANENKGSGFRGSSSNDAALFIRVTALTNNPGDGITVPSAQFAVVIASYIGNNAADGVHLVSLGTPPTGFANVVGGGIVCNNGGAGLRLESNVDVTALSGIALLLLASLLAWRGSQMVRRRRKGSVST